MLAVLHEIHVERPHATITKTSIQYSMRALRVLEVCHVEQNHVALLARALGTVACDTTSDSYITRVTSGISVF